MTGTDKTLTVFEEPKPTGKYLIGLDPPYVQDRGEFVVLVTKAVGLSVIPVALYHKKPDTMSLCYDQAVWLIKDYNKFGGPAPETRKVIVTYMANGGTADHTTAQLKRQGVGGLIMEMINYKPMSDYPSFGTRLGIMYESKLKKKIDPFVDSFIDHHHETLFSSGCGEEDLRSAVEPIFATIYLSLLEGER